MRTLIALIAVAGSVAIAAATAQAATRSVKVGDNYFVRAKGVPTVSVRAGDTVKWRFAGKNVHNVVVASGPAKFRSPVKKSGTFSQKLTKRGTYKIYCAIHGAKDQSMKLRVG